MPGRPARRSPKRFGPNIGSRITSSAQRSGALSAGGAPERCGWLRDRYGVPWRIVPTALPAMLADPDPAKAGRVVRAMLGTAKLGIAGPRTAYEGGPPG